MAKYSWSEFIREEYFNEIICFFKELMPCLESGERASFCVVFVSRKAYCLFLLLKEKGYIDDSGYNVYSDRYIMKKLDNEICNSKTIKLVDDTISTGAHFAEIYQMIEKKIKDVIIIPCILMEEENFHKNKLNRSFYKQRNIEISGKLIKNANAILRFCTIETLIMHQENIPYMIEIPNICDLGATQYYLHVTEDEFEKLKRSNDIWRYFNCKQAGYEQNEVGNDVVIRKNHILTKRFPEFIFNFLIRIQTTKVKDGYCLVLLPFAVLKSVKFIELWSFFCLIFDGTPYMDAINNYAEEHPDSWKEDVYIAVYRAVVFNLSMYIGVEYIDYLKSVLGGERKLDFYNKNYKYNFDDCFIDSNNRVLKATHSDYTTKLLSFNGFSKVISKSKGLKQYVRRYYGIKCDYRTVSLLFMAIINELRGEELINSDDDSQIYTESKRFSAIEEYQELLLDLFGDCEQEKLDDILSMCIVNMLSQSKISNEIYFDEHELFIYRGFKYGENSEAYLDLGAKVFFAAIVTFYDRYVNLRPEERMKNYERKYRMMLLYLKIFLMEYQLYGDVISRDEFRIYSEIFRARTGISLEQTIDSKRFLLDDPENPYYIENLKKHIKNADI